MCNGRHSDTVALPEPPPASKPSGFGRGLLVGLLVAIVVGGLVYALVASNPFHRAQVAGPSPPSSSGPSLRPSASPSTKVPPRLRPEVETLFSKQDWTMGRKSDLFVADFPLSDDRCRVHTFTVRGKTLGAFQSDCTDWASSGYDILIFYVAIRNAEAHAATFNLRNFVLVSRDGRTFGSVDVRAKADHPPNFLPEALKVPPKTNVVGYLTFDGRGTGLVPARLSYVDGRQTLTVVFDGKPSVV
jgi:hypothetical protein